MKIVKENIAFVQVSDLKKMDKSLPKFINIEKFKNIIQDGDDDFFIVFSEPEEIEFFKQSIEAGDNIKKNQRTFRKVLFKKILK